MEPRSVEYGAPRRLVLGAAFVLLMVAIVGLGMLFDARSPSGVRVVGLLAAMVFGTGARLLLKEEIEPRPSLRLDSSGLRLRLPPPKTGFHVPWPELVAIRVVGAGENAGVVLDVVDPDAPMLYPGGDPPIESRALPRLRGVRAENLAAEIERFRHASS